MSLPNFLTILRILIIPIIFYSFYKPDLYKNWISFSLFIIAALTDFLDGSLARYYKTVSRFGKIFDPISDKMLVLSLFYLLSSFSYISGIHLLPVLCIICREIFISGLREYLSKEGQMVYVTNLSKIKTFLQFLTISLFLVPSLPFIIFYAYIMLWICAGFSIISASMQVKKIKLF